MADGNPDLPEVIIYTRAGCHLCEEAKEQLRALRSQAEFTIRAVDIGRDPELQRLYNDEVPVIFINGQKAFKYCIDPLQFLRLLQKSGPRP